MEFIIKIFILLLLFNNPVFAQKEGNIWYFGNEAGIDFNGAVPVALTNSAMNTFEGCASVSDTIGNLLFYTNGRRVWNRNHTWMPNSFLAGNESSVQSSMILKKPGSSSIYYIFTTDYLGHPYGLRYSEVDMTLQGGLGNLTGSVVVVAAPVFEKLTAIKHQNNVDYWIIVQNFGGYYSCYLLTASGLNMTPVINNIGISTTNFMHTPGSLKSSLDGSKIASAYINNNTVNVYDFNNSTGVMSNIITIDSTANFRPYGVEFSPNGNLLYVSNNSSSVSNLYQFNLAAGSQLNINNSKLDLGIQIGNYVAGTLQLGPDYKIYYAISGASSLGVINNPNLQGLACNYVSNGISLAGKTSNLGLPNFFNSFLTIPSFSFMNTCFLDSTKFNIPNANIDSVYWNFGDPSSGLNNNSSLNSPTHQFSSSGSFFVSLYIYVGANNYSRSDSITIFESTSISLGLDTSICQGDTLVLDPIDASASYTWQDNSIDSVYNVIQSGTYWVNAIVNTCSQFDTINIGLYSDPLVNLGLDTTVCEGDTIVLDASFPNSTYVWQNYSTDSLFRVTQTGVYSVTVTDICSTTDSKIINYITEPLVNLGADTTLCQGELHTLETFYSNSNYIWSDNSINSSISVSQSGIYWVDVTNQCGTYRDSIDVSYNPLPSVNLGLDTSLCLGDSLFLDLTQLNYSYLWQDSSINSTFNITQPGTYHVEVTLNGCSSSDNINVYSITPSVLELGNDVILCLGEELIIDVTQPNSTYLWQDGSSKQSFIVSNSGLYIVKLVGVCETLSDSIQVLFEDCETKIIIPTVFSPNRDGINDIFSVNAKGIKEMSVTIFNRWGQQIWGVQELKNIEDISWHNYPIWDGRTTSGTQTSEGTYYYIINYVSLYDEGNAKKGSFTLFR